MLRAFIARAASSQAPLQTIDTHVRALNIFAKGEKFRAWILELVLKPNRPGERAPAYAKAPARSRLVNAAGLASGLAGSLWDSASIRQ